MATHGQEGGKMKGPKILGDTTATPQLPPDYKASLLLPWTGVETS